MMQTNQQVTDGLEILLLELMTDEELRDAFLRDPEGTLESASDWALPISESELQSLRGSARRIWDRVVDEVEAEFLAAA